MRMRVLVVEDDAFVADAVCDLIELLGYDCHLARRTALLLWLISEREIL
jgi:DNA-binding response OmpR family regulator